jgi:orotate phosphoribosyltransferase
MEFDSNWRKTLWAKWGEVFTDSRVFWTYDGDPKSEHVLLASGKHTSSYIDIRPVLGDAPLLDEICKDLADALKAEGLNFQEVDRIHGFLSDTKVFIPHMTRHIGTYEGRMQKSLLIDSVLTTGEGLARMVHTVERSGAGVLPMVGALINRTEYQTLDISGFGQKMNIVAVVHVPMPATVWTKESCPLCKEGSKAINPILPGSWKILNKG